MFEKSILSWKALVPNEKKKEVGDNWFNWKAEDKVGNVMSQSGRISVKVDNHER